MNKPSDNSQQKPNKREGRSNPLETIVMLRVCVENEILGNSERIMTLDKIKNYNKAAYYCAQKTLRLGGKQKYGMWTVEVV